MDEDGQGICGWRRLGKGAEQPHALAAVEHHFPARLEQGRGPGLDQEAPRQGGGENGLQMRVAQRQGWQKV